MHALRCAQPRAGVDWRMERPSSLNVSTFLNFIRFDVILD